jgi:hypothetical protein
MAECRSVRPLLVGQFEFVEWTPDNHLRHSRFVGLRLDKPARSNPRVSGVVPGAALVTGMRLQRRRKQSV